MKRTTLVKWAVMAAVLAAGAVAGVFLVRTSLQPAPEAEAPVAVEEAQVLQEFQLYFVADDGSHLVTEPRSLPACVEENACVDRLFAELIAGPSRSDLLPVVPAEARVLGIRQEAGVVLVDLSKEFYTRHPGGTLSELLTVYSMANTLAENFPHLRQIRLLKEGVPQETLKGHVSLKQPVLADFAFSRPPQRELVPGGNPAKEG